MDASVDVGECLTRRDGVEVCPSMARLSACAAQCRRGVIRVVSQATSRVAGQSEHEYETGREHEYCDGHEDEAEEVPV